MHWACGLTHRLKLAWVSAVVCMFVIMDNVTLSPVSSLDCLGANVLALQEPFKAKGSDL